MHFIPKNSTLVPATAALARTSPSSSFGPANAVDVFFAKSTTTPSFATERLFLSHVTPPTTTAR